ncbi:MAG: DUF4159 domain-containing protein [Leptospiraceae bacterium]|nr:DUF4159 domain-containing protein [Leptospiraceae bacterium]
MHILNRSKAVAVGILFLFSINFSFADAARISIGRLKYQGGDWYSNPSSLPNLLQRFALVTRSKIETREQTVSFADSTWRKVPVIYFTGHKGFQLSESERDNLREFLTNGGFLFADDNFGMDKNIRTELNSLFPGSRLQELPFSHTIFQAPYQIKNGVPKIHEHYGGAPKALGLFYRGRMVAFYAFNTDLGDGWEDLEVHGDGPVKHESALRMGVNVLHYALLGE